MSEQKEQERESINVGGVIIHKSDNGLYSLVDLWKANGSQKKKRPSEYTKLSSSKEIINELCSTPKNMSDRISGIDGVLMMINGGKNRGTYGCKELCFTYSMWLSPKFYVQVVRTFNALSEAKNTEELIQLKAQVDLFNSNAESMAHREPSDKQTIPVILGITSNQSQPYFDYLVGIGELTKKLIPQLPKAEYFATNKSKHVLGKKNKTVLFDNNIIDSFLKQASVFHA